MFRYFIYNTYLRCNFHSRFHFGAVFVGPDGLMQPPFHIFTIVKHNVFLMTASSPFAFSPKEVLWPLRFPWYQKQVTKALEKKKSSHRSIDTLKSPTRSASAAGRWWLSTRITGCIGTCKCRRHLDRRSCSCRRGQSSKPPSEVRIQPH